MRRRGFFAALFGGAAVGQEQGDVDCSFTCPACHSCHLTHLGAVAVGLNKSGEVGWFPNYRLYRCDDCGVLASRKEEK